MTDYLIIVVGIEGLITTIFLYWILQELEKIRNAIGGAYD